MTFTQHRINVDASALLRGLSVKLGLGFMLGHWQTMQIQIRCHRTRRLISICSVCLNNRKLRVKLIGLNPVSILHKSTAGRYRPVRVADGPITARCRFMKNASWEVLVQDHLRSETRQCCQCFDFFQCLLRYALFW